MTEVSPSTPPQSNLSLSDVEMRSPSNRSASSKRSYMQIDGVFLFIYDNAVLIDSNIPPT